MKRPANVGRRGLLSWRLVLPLLIFSGPALWTARAQLPPIAPRSVSGQFVIVGGASFSPGFHSPVPTNSGLVELNPMLLPVSCERIKQCLLRELGAEPAWQGKILLYLRPALRNDPGIAVSSERFQNKWQYRVELPTPVDRVLYVRGIVQALLIEMANRTPAAPGTEPPTWLIEGLTRNILSSREAEVILSPPESGKGNVAISPMHISQVKNSPFRASHDVVRRTRALTFEELSWPVSGATAGYSHDQYVSSAHLFVAGLLALPDGKACMRSMISRLPLHENWQLAFFSAFNQRFQTPLDVEKWWALQTVYLTGRDINKAWSAADSGAKLKEALQIHVRVHSSTHTLPGADIVSLQTALTTWEDKQLRTVLPRKARELEMVRLRVASNFVGIVEQYRMVLLGAVRDRQRAGLPFGIRKAAAQAEVSRRAAWELDRLDALLGLAMSANDISRVPAN
jgi:hypothetical protein